jgi:hypothetical protein
MESQSLLPAPDRTAFHTINPISRRLGHTVLCLSRRWGPVTGIQGVLLEPPRRPIKPKLLYVGVQAAGELLSPALLLSRMPGAILMSIVCGIVYLASRSASVQLPHLHLSNETGLCSTNNASPRASTQACLCMSAWCSPATHADTLVHAAAAAMLASDGISSAKAALGHALREKPSPRISKSDEDFENMGVEFVWGYHDLNLEDLNDLFSRVRPFMTCTSILCYHSPTEGKYRVQCFCSLACCWACLRGNRYIAHAASGCHIDLHQVTQGCSHQ